MLAGLRAQILKEIQTNSPGVRELLRTMPHRNETILETIRDMENHGLIRSTPSLTRKRGRPKNSLSITPLGTEYLTAYQRLEKTQLQASQKDYERAVRDAEYATRLVTRGIDPFQAFMELNTIVRTSRDSA